ncbi:MAG: hypothetical protein HBSAPP03_27760 [Phycisphaerae bacterium]|nr:MAG: hypothetical protein HBSAPP03_27760 [Phycisphaerae bacterium]
MSRTPTFVNRSDHLPAPFGSGWRKGFATLLVFGVIVFASIVIGVLQSSAFAQAAAGRESLGRVRATWAARAGVEETIASLEQSTENPNGTSAFAEMDAMVAVAEGQLAGATWRIATTDGKQEVLGPADAGAKLNINRMTKAQLMALEPFMSDDVADAVLDWIDADEDPQPLGAEATYYQSLEYPLSPRNAPMRSIAELELIAGMDPRDVRGEDWNLNGLLDPNEDDGDASWPPDNADGVLDAGYSAILTASSVDGGLSVSGQTRIDLTATDEGELVSRLKVTNDQAKAIVDYMAATPAATMADFITQDLNTLARRARGQQGGGGRGQPQQPRVESLTTAQLGALLDESQIGPPEAGARLPGKLNINTCPAEVLDFLPEIQPETADAIIAERSARPQGFTSVGDLLAVPGIGRRQLAAIHELLCVRSNVFIVTCRGRDAGSGVEVEMRVTLNRASLPLVIEEVVVR